MQVIWKGAISFGLVSIPIKLFAATEERGVALHQIHAKDGGRIRYRRVCTVDGEEVPYSDIARGYGLPDGEVVVLTDEDFADLPLSSSRTIDVLSFMDAAAIDPVQLSRCYYCEPADSDPKPYVLLREALERTEKIAVVKVALRQRESLAALRPRDGVLVLQLMLWPDEVRDPSFSFLDDDVRLRPQELQMAESYVEALSGEIDPEEMVDRYRVALEQLVEAKLAGRQVEHPPAPMAGTGMDLMEALRRSVEKAKRDRDEEAPPATPPKRAAAKSAPQKKATTKRTGPPQPAAVTKATGKKAAGKAANKKAAAKKAATRKKTLG